MTFIVCPHCGKSFDLPKGSRTCYDCKKPIGRHGKYHWVVRKGVPTIVHKDCKVPDGGPGFKHA